ncbi:MAG: c-type cytochrome [Bacteroidota bacterium]
MKRITILTAFIIAMFAVNSFAQTTTKKTTKSTKKTTTTTKPSAKPSAVTLEEGKQLLAKNDCLSCHKVDVKIVGPAYKDVAKKYPATTANYDLLTKKVIAGGSGVWGEVPMSAHPSIPPADVKKMVQYILSVK